MTLFRRPSACDGWVLMDCFHYRLSHMAYDECAAAYSFPPQRTCIIEFERTADAFSCLFVEFENGIGLRQKKIASQCTRARARSWTIKIVCVCLCTWTERKQIVFRILTDLTCIVCRFHALTKRTECARPAYIYESNLTFLWSMAFVDDANQFEDSLLFRMSILKPSFTVCTHFHFENILFFYCRFVQFYCYIVGVVLYIHFIFSRCCCRRRTLMGTAAATRSHAIPTTTIANSAFSPGLSDSCSFLYSVRHTRRSNESSVPRRKHLNV